MSSEINKKTDNFLQEFNGIKSIIRSKIDNIQPPSNGDTSEILKANLDEIQSDLERMKFLLAEGSLFLPSYTLKSAQDAFNQLTKDYEQKHDELIPRKKFSFAKKTRPPNSELHRGDKKHSQDVIDFVKSSSSSPSALHNKSTDADPTKSVSFKDLTGMSIRNTKEEGESIDVTGKDVTIVNLIDCDIEIQGSPKTVYIDNLRNCSIKVGPVSASIMVYNCNDSRLHLVAQQLRIHNTKNCQFYIHISSRSIIEDCSGLKFGQLKPWYDGMNCDFEKAALDINRNNWQCIDDFNWPSKSLKSPNYELILESDQ